MSGLLSIKLKQESRQSGGKALIKVFKCFPHFHILFRFTQYLIILQPS